MAARKLYSHNILFLTRKVLLDQDYVAVGDGLYIGFGVFRSVFAQAVLLGFLDAFNGFTADVADGNLRVFSFSLRSLDQLATPFLGQWGKKETDDHPVVLGIDANIGIDDGPFNGLEHIFFPGLDADGAGVHDADVTYLVNGCRGSIIIHHDAVEHLGVGLSGPDLSK